MLILLYCVIGIAWYYGQEKMLFHPVAIARNHAFTFSQPSRELNIPFDSSTNISVVQFPATDRPADSPAKGVVLYFHGNAGNIEDCAVRAADFTSKGYEIWFWDYPGFGKSTGKISESILYRNGLVFYKLARSRWQPDQIIIYGNSLGTGLAAQLASVRDCRRLILQSPYYSMTSLGRRYLFLYPVDMMLHYHIPTYSFLSAVAAPVTIFHGEKDATIPYSNSSRLKPLLKSGDEFVTIPDGGHDNLRESTLFRAKLDSVLKF